MKKHLSTILLIFIFIVGLAVLLYPSVSNIYNNNLHSSAIASYDNQLSTFTSKDYSEYWKAADGYNEQIKAHGSDMHLVNGEPQNEEYIALLDVIGTGMMGYIEIPAIDVQLPIYHGTSDAVLAAGVGHLEGSSLPGGGKGTHTVLSGHRGLPSAKLFTDLDELEIGDMFYLNILDKTLAYQVDQINIVLPSEVSDLTLEPEEDYVTLITCTPYGINSHRLLVRGKRVAFSDSVGDENSAAEQIRVYRDAVLYDVYVIAPIASVPLFLIMLVFMLIRYRGKRR